MSVRRRRAPSMPLCLLRFVRVVLLSGAVESAPSSLQFIPNGSLTVAVKRRRQETTLSAPDFFDNLRIDLATSDGNYSSISKEGNSSIYTVTLNRNQGNATTYRLAEIKTFIPFSNGTEAIPEAINDGFSAVLAMHHFNNMQERGHPVLGDQVAHDPVLASCNVKLTMELLDSQFSPTKTTQTISSVLQRATSLQTPPTTAVVGAYRSAMTLPLAIFTGVNHIPQVSASATSTGFDDKEQFPIFGRTVTNTVGEAAVALRFFQSIGSTHVAILFVTDSYGSALQKAFQDASTEVGIVTESLAFGSSVSEKEARSVVASLKLLQFRHVYAIFFVDQLEPIMNAAFEVGAVGPDYLYLFPGLDVFAIQQSLRMKDGSPMAQSFHGVGLIQMQGGVTTDRVVQGKHTTPSFNEESTSGFDLFRVSWRDAVQDKLLVHYAQSLLPSVLDEMPGFDRNAEFADDPGGLLHFLYDAVTAFGLSMCQAGVNSTFFTGEDIYGQFRDLDFEGASGNVRIMNETGTRDYSSMSFAMWNVQTVGVDTDGYTIIEWVPSHRFDGDRWETIPGNAFEFADGTRVAPASLPPVSFNFHYIGKTSRTIGYTLMGVIMVSAMALVIWTVLHRRSHVVDSAQPLFLIMIGGGVFIMASAILPLGLDETIVSSTRGLDIACMAVPWLYFLGSSISFSALLAKTKALHEAFMDPEIEVIHVSSVDIVRFAAVLASMNFVLLISWSLVSPLEWTRVLKDNTDIFNRFLESYAVCASDKYVAFIVVIVAINLVFLILGTYWAYRTRNVATEYNESRYIGMSITAVLQAWTMGIPILIIVRDNPSASFFAQSGLVFVTSLCVVALVFVPKARAVRQEAMKAREPRVLHGGFKRRSNRLEIVGSDDERNDTEPPFPANRVSLSSDRTEPSHDEGGRTDQSPAAGKAATGIKIIHNPRSSRNLLMTGGIELSLRQLEMLQESEEYCCSKLSMSMQIGSQELRPAQEDQVNTDVHDELDLQWGVGAGKEQGSDRGSHEDHWPQD